MLESRGKYNFIDVVERPLDRVPIRLLNEVRPGDERFVGTGRVLREIILGIKVNLRMRTSAIVEDFADHVGNRIVPNNDPRNCSEIETAVNEQFGHLLLL